ncbi:MAG: alginate export family protein [Spirochaetales bacterium]|nr:alginate export family protein [Leptospiraceae bacterium]MCP5483577.1 alginate export family protein [Spirochaetales bacterium]MCP5486431.1 alginate export family protein [Spirochaetales bacterium]
MKLHRNFQFFVAGLMAVCVWGRPLQAQDTPEAPETPAPELTQRMERLLDALEGFDVFGLVRFRPEMRSNYDFNRDGVTCTSGICQSNNDDSEFVGQKIQVGVEYKFSEQLRARVVIQDSRVWGGETGSDTGLNTANDSTNQSTDIREAWIGADRLLGPLDLIVGRQVLAFGDERLVGSLDWTNVGRSFDSVRLRYRSEFLESNLWGSVLAEEDSDSAGNSSSVGSSRGDIDDAYFVGFYNTLHVAEQFQADVYYLGRYLKWQRSSTPPVDPTVAARNLFVPVIDSSDRSRQRDNLHTIGARLTNRTAEGGRAPGMFDWTLEYAWQTGESGRRVAAGWDQANIIAPLPSPLYTSVYNPCDVYATTTSAGVTTQGCRFYTEKQIYDAFAFAAAAGVRFLDMIRVGVEFDVGSGDPNRTDATVSTFNNLFHTNHKFYGQADQVSWQNMIGRSVNLSLDFKDYGKLDLAYWEVDKHRSQDAWYKVTGGGSSGATVRTTESNSNARYASTYNSTGSLNSLGVGLLRKHLFREYDVAYSLTAGGIAWSVGYSLIYAGDAARAALNDDLVVQATYAELVRRDLLDGVIDDPASFNALYSRPFDPAAHFAYVMMTYKF